jgi:PAS domain S-box-containing protein
MNRTTPSGRETFFDDEEIIVSKTDLKGRITYANDVFLRIADYRASEVLGQPHSMIRHPDMPRCVFQLLWDTIAKGEEIFAYVVNMAKNGDHYWVFAHVTPTFDKDGKVIGYHSNRRVPDRKAVDAIKPIYAHLKAIEDRHTTKREGIAAATEELLALLAKNGVSYGEFVFGVGAEEAVR